MQNANETKLCKHCQTEIPKKAKVCPNCRKKQGGIVKWIVIAFVVLLIIGAIGGSSEDDSNTNDNNTENVGNTNTSSEKENSENNGKENQKEEIKNEFKVGDVVKTSNLKISFLSSGEWQSDNQFIQPKDGYKFHKVEFEFENISKKDQYISSADFECYADGYSMEKTYYGDDILSIATLSSGKKVKGAIYFEIPENAESVILEYETNFWTEKKIVFVIK